MTHKKHAKKRRRSPIFIPLILLLLIVVFGVVTLRTAYSKLGKIQTKSLDKSQLVTVNNDNNMSDYTNYAFFVSTVEELD